MPVYEYRCTQCRHKTALFVRAPSTPAAPACERCGSDKLSRLFSTFAVHRSSAGSSEDLDDDGAFGDMDESDPRAMARMMRGMGNEMGEELGPEFDEMVDRVEAGEELDDLDGGGDEFDDF